ncbi:MAG TPA: PHB depolymerase family esterase [Smithellaceae bacterium]|nr:PHB depolymerase family esterase [Smithellaceae bacterium]
MKTARTAFVCLLITACLYQSSWAAGANFSVWAERRTIVHNGLERIYEVRVPTGALRSEARVPLVLVLHGRGGSSRDTEKITGFTFLAVSEHFIVVYPEGARLKGPLTWNAGHCCGDAMRGDVDDVGFIDALLDRLIEDYPIDPGRVYVTGMSNGAMMAHRLGIDLSHRIAAIAPVIGAIFGDEKPPSHPVSALIINGMQDNIIPYAGGIPAGASLSAWDGTPFAPGSKQASFWAAANECDGNPDLLSGADTIVTRYRCPDGRRVLSYLIRNMGHTWPGAKTGKFWADRREPSFYTTEVIWAFFKTNAKKLPSSP